MPESCQGDAVKALARGKATTPGCCASNPYVIVREELVDELVDAHHRGDQPERRGPRRLLRVSLLSAPHRPREGRVWASDDKRIDVRQKPCFGVPRQLAQPQQGVHGRPLESSDAELELLEVLIDYVLQHLVARDVIRCLVIESHGVTRFEPSRP